MSIPEKKICPKCGLEKKAEEYTIKKTKRGKYYPHLSSRCKKCCAERSRANRPPYDAEKSRAWRDKNPERCKIHYRKNYEKKQKRWKDFMSDKSCSRCGFNDSRCLQWHHTDPATKTMTIGAQARLSRWDDVMREIEKCICLCANCHFIVEDEIKNKRTPHDQDENEQQTSYSPAKIK